MWQDGFRWKRIINDFMEVSISLFIILNITGIDSMAMVFYSFIVAALFESFHSPINIKLSKTYDVAALPDT